MTVWIRVNSSTGECSEYDDGLPDAQHLLLRVLRLYDTAELHVYEICPVCFWQDVYQGEHNLDFRDPWNHMVSLRQAHQNFLAFGAGRKKMKKHVRDPLPEERVGA